MRESDKKTIPFSPPDVGEMEIERLAEVIRSGWITTGPKVAELEQRIEGYIKKDICLDSKNEEQNTNGSRVACLGSATAALELSLRILGIGSGDEVIVPAYTYTATASPVLHCGAKIVFTDIQKNGDPYSNAPEPDYDAIERAVSPRTKAIILADIGGAVCDYDRVFGIVERKRPLFAPKASDGTVLGDLSSRIQKGLGCPAVIADCAHSLGSSRLICNTGCGPLKKAEWRKSGDNAHFSSFSFHAVKNFTTAEGGAATWNLPPSVYDQGVTDSEIHHMYRMLSLHGQSRDALSKTAAGAWEYDVIGPWYKCNMTDLSAAVGLAQLDRYDGMLEHRHELIRRYDRCCDELGISHLVHMTAQMQSNGHLYMARIPELDETGRNRLIQLLADMGVSANVHFKPLPMLTAYRSLGYDISRFPNAYDYYRCEISMPLYSRLTVEDVEYVCDKLEKALDIIRK